MKDGKLVEHGTLSELIARDGVLKAMWSQYSDSAWSLEAAGNT
jgi:ABC-type multidrug transport system fused ATPase/permease subunit